MSSFIPIKGKTGECDPHRPPVPEAYYTKRETDALLATKVSFDQFNNHTLNTTVHITAEERAAWNNKITEPEEEGSAGDVLVTDGEGGRTWSASPTHTATWGQITGTLSNQTDLHTRLTTDETNISNEVTRATSAEGLLGQRITTETTRATNAESVLTSSIAAEVTRAQGAEATLQSNLTAEATTRGTADETLQDNIDAENARAEEAELIIQQNVESEATRAQGAETTLNNLITAEVTRAGVAETQLQSNITAEATTRAAADTTLTTNLAAEVTRATGVEATKENVSNKVTEILSTSTHTEYASAKSVYDAISAIPKALVYKGTIGVGGTIQVLPEATEDRGGWTYKVITEAIYPPMTEKASIGDLIVCAWEEEPQPEGTYKWTLIPAGAEKVKDVQINGTSILTDAGIANIPVASTNSLGTVKMSENYGSYVDNTGALYAGTVGKDYYSGRPNSLFVGKGTLENIKTDLTGRALADTSAPAYTTEQKTAAQNRLGVTEAIATETTRATTAEATKVDKTAIRDTGIKSTTYTQLITFTATTAVTTGQKSPYALINLTAGLDKTKRYKVVINSTEHILPCEMWGVSSSKVYEYLGNIDLKENNTSQGFYPVRSTLTFLLTQDANNDSKWELYTSTAGEYTVTVYTENLTLDKLPNELIWGTNYSPILVKDNGGSTFAGVSIGGTNKMSNARGGVAIGDWNTITSEMSYAIGLGNTVNGAGGVAIGNKNTASNTGAIAEGLQSSATKMAAHAEGYQTLASGIGAHAEGIYSGFGTSKVITTASGNGAHAEGAGTISKGVCSHTEGLATIGSSDNQHVQGKYNVEDTNSTYAHIVGNGTADNARSNAHTLDWSGNAEFAGDVTINGCGGENPISVSSIKTAVDSKVADVKINGTTIVDENKCANIPAATTTQYGVLKASEYWTGLMLDSSGCLKTASAPTSSINARTDQFRPIVPSNLNYAVTAALTDSNKAVLTDTQKESAKNTIGVDTDINRIDNYIDGNLNGKTTNTEVANIKNLPTNVYSTTVNDIGGNSIVWNQCIDNVTVQTDPTYEVRPANQITSLEGHVMYTCATVKSDGVGRLFLSGVVTGTEPGTTSSSWTKLSYVGPVRSGGFKGYYPRIASTGVTTVASCDCKNFMYIDLTLMFGAGNEPSTVAEFEAMFPNAYYPYSVPTVTHAAVDKVIYQGLNLFNHDDATTIEGYKAIRYDRPVAVRIDFKSGVTSVPAGTYVGVIYKNDGASSYSATWFYANTAWSRRVCINGGSGYDNVLVGCYPATALQYFDISVYENDYATEADVPPITPYYHTEVNVPTAVQQLEGYGWGIGNYYNEVNYSTKKYIKRVGMVDMGTLTWRYYAETAFFYCDFPQLAYHSVSVNVNLLSDIYTTSTVSHESMPDKSIQGRYAIHSAGHMGLAVKDSAYTDAAAFKAAMSGKYLYYELSTPVETDITSLLTNTDIIKDTVTKNHITAQFNNTLQLPMYNSITSTSKKSVVNDVTINNTSIVTDGVANIPIANLANKTPGLLYSDNYHGLVVDNNYVSVQMASSGQINNRNNVSYYYNSIVPYNLDYAVKAALTDGVGAAYTTTEQAAARTRIGAQKSKFFDVTYGTTTYAEITAAIEAGLTPICTYSYSSSETNSAYLYNGTTTAYHYFSITAPGGTTTRFVRVNASNTWSVGSVSQESPYQLRECSPVYVGPTGMTKYKICAFDVDNRLVEMSIGDTVSTTKTPCTVGFRPDTLYYFNSGSTYTEGQATPNAVLYPMIYLGTASYTFNGQIPAYHDAYLCGSYDHNTGLFTLDQGQTSGIYDKFYKFVPANTSGLVLSDYFETGKYYIKIGRGVSSAGNTMQLCEEKPMYYFNGSALVDGRESWHCIDATSFESLPVKSGYYFVY